MRERGRTLRISEINQLAVAGFKSISQEQVIDIAPLTILAGTNSSGKSSIVQPLLLLKQTLESTYDPGPLQLHGANIKFNEAKQLFYKGGKEFHISLMIAGNRLLKLFFNLDSKKQLLLSKMDYSGDDFKINLTSDMKPEGIKDLLENLIPNQQFHYDKLELELFRINRFRCFLDVEPFRLSFIREDFSQAVQSVIHLPGLRGNPERAYPLSATGNSFPGTFENYTASIIAQWQETKDNALSKLGENLSHLGLTWKVEARRLDDTKVELRVGRTQYAQRAGAKDMVNVADVGVGVSQILPVLVSLLTARAGQLVFIEQPEIHLHPRAQVALARILVDAAKRKVLVVVETHSSILLLAVQSLIAEDFLDSSLVKLHWFQRNEIGETTITSANLDEVGAFGNWPQDFGDVILDVEQHYLDVAEKKMIEKRNALSK